MKYPRGKLNADDEGRLEIRIFVKDATAVIDFGKAVAWLGFGLHELEAFHAKIGRTIADLKGKAS